MWLTLQNMDSYSSTRRFRLGGLTAVLRLAGLVFLHEWILWVQDRGILGTYDSLFGVILITLLFLFPPQDMLFTLYKIHGYHFYLWLLLYPPSKLKFQEYIYEFSFIIINSPLLFIGKKSVLVYIVMMVYRLIIWKYLGLEMDSYKESKLLKITEYFFIFYALYCSIKLFITLVKLFIVEALKIIQLVRTHGLYSVTILTDFISSRVLSQLFLFWIAYFAIAIKKGYETMDQETMSREDLQVSVCNCTDMCRSIVGLAAASAAVSYISHYLRLISRLFLHGCENVTALSESNKCYQEGMVFFSIVRFVLSKTDFQERDPNNQVGFILLLVVTIFLNSVHQLLDSEIFPLRAFPAIHIFKSIRVLIMYGLLLPLFLYVDHAVCMLVGFDISFPIAIMGLSKCIQIIFTIDMYYTISIRRVIRSLDSVNYVKSRLQLLDCSMRRRIQHDSDYFVCFTLLSQCSECISNSFVLRREASKSLFRNKSYMSSAKLTQNSLRELDKQG